MTSGSIGRRSFLKTVGTVGLLALVPRRRLEAMMASAPGPGQPGVFLDAHELDTLRAVTARFIPGPPDDPDPGAVEARVAEAIDMLLGAFRFDPPLIHAGGPFSDRAGSTIDDFAAFVPLDAHAELGWRIRLEGSNGDPAREFAGPVVGLQAVYRDGLAHLDDRSRSTFGADFVALLGLEQDLLLSDQTDADLQTFVGAALANTLEAMYGPPEYGGNQGLAGWSYTDWAGDRQPAGYTDEQVSKPDRGAGALVPELLPRIERFLPGLLGRRAPRGAFWLGRKAFMKG